jgi:hypothetical protein
MLTDLNFLGIGKNWPPDCERARLELYKTNRDLFENKHAEVYEEQFKRINRVIGNFENVISYPVVINFQRLISLKTADLLFLEPPKFSCGEEGATEQVALDKIIAESDFINMCYETALDVSRYGDGLLYIYHDGTKGNISVMQPEFWFPIVSPDNIKETLYHVKAWTITRMSGEVETIYLKVQIHERGFYTEREYKLNRAVNGLMYIEAQTMEDLTYDTGLENFAIVQVPNIISSNRVYGMDDYSVIDSLVSELLVMVSNISKILDKHADPSVTGPLTALEQDPKTGQYRIRMGNYFARNDEQDPKIEYITWDAQLSAAFQQIETIVNYLACMSEMGAVIFSMMKDSIGNVPSGSALKKMFMSALSKVARIRMRFDPAMKKALSLCGQLNGVSFENMPISITWQDGLPSDAKEESEVLASRTGNKATMSVKRALMQFDGMSEEQAEQEMELINEEDAMNNPMHSMNTPFAGDNEPDDGEKANVGDE